jgi:NifU-like protein involved in Fe-S cluster formation
LILRAPDPYNRLVRQYFVSPVHAGTLRNRYRFEVVAEASDGNAALLRLMAGTDAVKLGELRFQALGCPHLIAAAEDFCRHYEGKPLASLYEFRPGDTMRELEIPVTKTGRILLLEDAI